MDGSRRARHPASTPGSRSGKVGIFKPSFLILDLVMPKLDGLHVCRRLRANPETRDIKILAVTGRPDMVQERISSPAVER